MPEPQTAKPTQDKPMWEYAAGGLLWGFGFFGAALILKKAFAIRPPLDDDDYEELREWTDEDEED